MSPRTASRRRMVAAATVVACMLVAGPAAYAAGAATADREDTTAENIAGSGSGSGASSSSAPGQDSGSDGSDDSGGSGSDRNAEGGDSEGGDSEGPNDNTEGRDSESPNDDAEGGDDDAGDNDGPDQDAAADLDVLASDCSGSDLPPHDGFQKAPRCVSTSFGEVASADKSPSLLITDSPDRVAPGEAFSMTVSTRNLVRDRFLPAAEGKYYAESSLLNDEGLQRGHFHTACRMLPNPDEAPDAAPEPLFFKGTEDGGGGSAPDEVTIEVPGVDQAGELQCTSWAGDGSHRIPMMQRANQTPAVDSVRVEVG